MCSRNYHQDGDVDGNLAAEVRQLVRSAKIADDVGFSTITKLNLSGCGLSCLPSATPSILPNLSILFLSNNNFKEMPAIIGDCKKLQMVAFKSNGMTSVNPDALQPQLRWLILTDNIISELPETIGRCQLLQKCMLSGNKLQSLPDSIRKCGNLELIRLASNCLVEPPVVVLSELPELRWVALGDNPFLANMKNGPTKELHAARIITDLDETKGVILGQGAGGVTRKVEHNGKPVAVKVYGGAMTSDGLPETERKISVAASKLNCAGLIKVIGECETTGSLVMEYLEDFVALAGPPSLDSCSRDVYGPAAACESLSWEEAVNMVTVLLHALSQLHHAGITHGDFYGHNILVQRNDMKQVRLSDFGAAFFYDKTTLYGHQLQRIELKAFAVLVTEVAALLGNTHGEQKHLLALASQCDEPDATFDYVQEWWASRP